MEKQDLQKLLQSEQLVANPRGKFEDNLPVFEWECPTLSVCPSCGEVKQRARRLCPNCERYEHHV
jgi:uncharacterized OB-fold protein